MLMNKTSSPRATGRPLPCRQISCIGGDTMHSAKPRSALTWYACKPGTGSMLNTRQHRELHDPHQQSPALFGKPWFWQRTSSTMEGTRSLARVIMEMREEIRKLEDQKRVLPKDRDGEVDQEDEQTRAMFLDEEQENPYLKRNVSAPILKGQFKEYKDNVVMTVRRYSMNSRPPGVTRNERVVDPWMSHFGWARLQEEVLEGNGKRDRSVTSDVASASDGTSLQEYVHKTRDKVKTVTFLLPVDDIYTSKPVMSRPQEATPTKLPIT
ncbi:uncharacterized protein LOC127609402 isoform X1 [Hippocampus zosterae]|uniref:uncharacterized protein LOC127609402 isoform X1 n=1 Tax=Hippocampus zosterae TaxID=109293 RepID=UPI00223E530B|nr:uncharacterized protein LOC127609402 isoform X1 [Hippocampus zosterae]